MFHYRGVHGANSPKHGPEPHLSRVICGQASNPAWFKIEDLGHETVNMMNMLNIMNCHFEYSPSHFVYILCIFDFDPGPSDHTTRFLLLFVVMTPWWTAQAASREQSVVWFTVSAGGKEWWIFRESFGFGSSGQSPKFLLFIISFRNPFSRVWRGIDFRTLKTQDDTSFSLGADF